MEGSTSSCLCDPSLKPPRFLPPDPDPPGRDAELRHGEAPDRTSSGAAHGRAYSLDPSAWPGSRACHGSRLYLARECPDMDRPSHFELQSSRKPRQGSDPTSLN